MRDVAFFFCLIMMLFHFGFGKRILVINWIKETGWFRNTRLRSLNSKLTFLSVIIGTIITYIRRFSFAKIFYGI